MSYGEQERERACADFPALARRHNGHAVAYLDGPGGTQVPEAVLGAIRESYIERNANYDGVFSTSVDVTAALHDARQTAATFLGAADPKQISFGANMTTLNFSLSRALGRELAAGDEIVITQLDHEANRGPWLKLRERGAVVKEARLLRDGTLDMEHFLSLITHKTRIVAFGMASNALGTVTPLAPVRARCQAVGAKLVLDAVHYAAHFPLDVSALDADFLLCSAYKFYGPHVGILYCRDGLLDTLDTDHLRTQKSIAPYRIETGTLNHAALAGVVAAVVYLAAWGEGSDCRAKLLSAMQGIHDYETELARYYYGQVAEISDVTVWGPGFSNTPRAPTVSITHARLSPEALAIRLAEEGIQVWHGHFYAMKVLEVLGLVESGGLMRAGFSLYNSRAEVDRLIDCISAA